MDQTGLSWSNLINAVFEERCSDRASDMERNRIIMSLLKEESRDPQQKASIVIQELKNEQQSETDFLLRSLTTVLYRNRGWGEGLLLKHICNLAFTLAHSGANVSLVTTNYDDYIVRSVTKLIDSERIKADVDISGCPGAVLNILGESAIQFQLRKPRGQAGNIDITYIHGLAVDENRPINIEAATSTPGDLPEDSTLKSVGQIVFSEESYAKTQLRTTKFLDQLLANSSAFICVGASMTDPPLVNALCNRKESKCLTVSLSTDRSKLEPLALTTENGQHIVEGVLGSRFRHIGIKNPLFPSNYNEVAQFIEEIRVCSQVNKVSSSPGDCDYTYELQFQKRLENWHANYSKLNPYENTPSDTKVLYQQRLSEAVIEIENLFHKISVNGSPSEIFRIEVWAPIDVLGALDGQQLTLVANSTGIIIDDTLRPSLSIHSSLNSPAAMAFRAGKIVMCSTENAKTGSSRWKSSFAMPLITNLEYPLKKAQDEDISAHFTCGVVTLESSLPYQDSETKDTDAVNSDDFASFLDSRVDPKDYQLLIEVLGKAGRDIIFPQEENDELGAVSDTVLPI